MNQMKEVPQTRKRYSEEFKQQAVQLALSGECPRRQTAQRLGVSYHTLQLWVKQHRQQQQPGAQSQAEREELKRLRKEKARLQMEIDILKKADRLLRQQSEQNTTRRNKSRNRYVNRENEPSAV